MKKITLSLQFFKKSLINMPIRNTVFRCYNIHNCLTSLSNFKGISNFCGKCIVNKHRYILILKCEPNAQHFLHYYYKHSITTCVPHLFIVLAVDNCSCIT